MWIFVAVVAVISVAVSELCLLSLYLILGDEAFGKDNAFVLAALVPMAVSLPICFITSRMALQLSQAHSRLKELAHTDELTGLINRRSFFQRAEDVLLEAADNNESVALLVIDADYFKQLNDTYGHATGDAALQFIAGRLESCVRKYDPLCRLGGEEFAILLPDMSEESACRLADRVIRKISAQPMVWDNKIIEMSVSCGIADTRVGYDMTRLFKAADDALYAAKRDGRNRHLRYTQMEEPSPDSAERLL